MLLLNDSGNSSITIHSLQYSDIATGERCNKCCHNARHTAHSTANYRNLATAFVKNILKACFLKHLACMLYIWREYGKHCFLFGKVETANADACIRQILKQVAACGNILRIEFNAELGKIAKVSDTAGAGFVDSNFAAAGSATALISNERTGCIAEGGFYVHRNVAAHGDFNSTRVNYLSTVVCHLTNLGVGNLLKDIGILYNTRISGHNAFYIRIYFYKISL